MERKILILEENSNVAVLFQKITKNLGYQSSVTNNLNEFYTALDVFKPSLVILDFVTLESDIVTALQTLSVYSANAKLIISSGIGGASLEASIGNAHQHGLEVIGTLQKPFPPEQLEFMLNNYFSTENQIAL